MRVFLAIEVPKHIKSAIENLNKKLKHYSEYMRLTDIKNLHFTVKFLGEQNAITLNKIKEISTQTIKQFEPFEINIKKSGVFGGLKNPKILWLGEDNEHFTEMSSAINSTLNIFRHEEKKIVCHLTIGRIKRIAPEDMVDILRICKEFTEKNDLRFRVGSVYLYKSNLLKSGAVYEKIEKFNLKEK